MLFHRRWVVSIGLQDFMGREAAGQRGRDLVLPTQVRRVVVAHLSLAQVSVMTQTSVISFLPQLRLPSPYRLLEHELAFGPSSLIF